MRKLIHLVMTAIPAIAWLVSHQLALALCGALVVASLVVEAARRWWPWVNQFLWRLLPSVFREWEDRRVLGSTWFALGAAATLFLFGRDAGSTAILFTTWGDPAAELAGRRWGRPDQRKTVVGSSACFLACLAAGAVGVWLGGLSPWSALAGAIVATAVERWSPPPDDNLWMPLVSGLVMMAVQLLVAG
jgi:dolichol kinase